MSPSQAFPYRADLMGDFKDATWLPARDLLHGRDPYDPAAFTRAHGPTQGYSPYTPSHLLIGALFAPWSWPIGTAAWSALSAVSIATLGAFTGARAARTFPQVVRLPGTRAARMRVAGTGVAGTRAARTRVDTGWSARAVVLACAATGITGAWLWRPSAMAMGLGQPSALYAPVAAMVGVAVLIPDPASSRSRRATLALIVGAALALGKPQIGLQVLLALAVARQWRIAFGAIGLAGLASLGVAIRLAGGPGRLLHWLTALPGHLGSAPSRFAAPGDDPWVDVSALAYRAGLRHGLPAYAGPLAALAVLVVTVAATVRLRRCGRPALAALTLTVGGLSAIPHAQYDAILLFPVVVLAVLESRATVVGALHSPRSGAGPWAVIPAVATIVLVLALGAIPNDAFGLPVEPAALGSVLLVAACVCAVIAAWTMPSGPCAAQPAATATTVAATATATATATDAYAPAATAVEARGR